MRSALQILAVGFDGGGDHTHITCVRWRGASSFGVTTAAAVIAWLQADAEHEAWVWDGKRAVGVEVFAPGDAPAYLRSRADGRWGDHLLRLPSF